MPAWITLPRHLRRVILGYGRQRPDAAPGCPERFDLAFLRFALAWNRTRRARSLGLVEGFPGRRIVLRGPRAVRLFLEG